MRVIAVQYTVVMKKPPPRPCLPPRRSNNDKRRLLEAPDANLIQELQTHVNYRGSPKHKRHPHLFGLPPYQGARGDESLCDEHAGFAPAHMAAAPKLIERGICAGLISDGPIGSGRILWTVADTGWIFEARLTNVQQSEYHGYPVRGSEPIACCVYQRFAKWVQQSGTTTEKMAADNCKILYGFK